MPSKPNVTESAEVIKLGLDIHASKYVVARQIDGSSPQSPQRFTPEQFLIWAKKQTRLAKKVYCCYEAGCFGYWLHRRLEAMGVVNYVVRPRNWDEYGQKVKTDKRDAAELLQNLDRFIAGNTRALQPVRIPTEEEERQRSESRQRNGLSKERKRLENQGTSAARYYGLTLSAEWWKPKKFEGAGRGQTLIPVIAEVMCVCQESQAFHRELFLQDQAMVGYWQCGFQFDFQEIESILLNGRASLTL